MPDGARRPARLVAQAAPGLPADRMVVGKPVEAALALLPRLFNLCRVSQGAAAAAALGRPHDAVGLAAEVLRDHLLKLHVAWPGFFGAAARPLPDGWAEGGTALLRALFGPAAAAPATASDFDAWLAGGNPYAQTLRRIDGCFSAGEAVAAGLPLVDAASVWGDAPVENSVAARHASHPALRGIEVRLGRGPLWRAAARLYDIEAAALGRLPAIVVGPGRAVAPSPRGAYAVAIEARAGTVAALSRITPTDALLAEGGMLERCLATLPSDKTGLGALMLDILDPCSPVRLREVADA